MTSKDKLVKKLMNAPQNINYFDIETLFQNENFEIEW
jgi:hypothetical protein